MVLDLCFVLYMKERMERVKLRWAIPWALAQTWSWSQIFCSQGGAIWGISSYGFLSQVPAMEAAYLHGSHSPLQCRRADWDFSTQPGIRAGWVRGVQTDGCQQECYQQTCQQKKEASSPLEVLWNLCWKFSMKTNCPHAPLSSVAGLGSINSVWNL